MSTTIVKGLRVLEILAYAGEPRGISEIARDLDLNKSAVQRILTTLQARGYVTQEPGARKYQLSLSLWELGSHAVADHPVRRLVQPIMRYAAQRTGFTAFLTCASFPFFLYLHKVEGAHGRMYSVDLGKRVPLTRTAAGKAILAYLPDELVEQLRYPHADWTGFVTTEPDDPAALREEIAVIRAAGYATSESGLIAGGNSVAAPIWWDRHEPFGSLLLTADDQSLRAENFAELGVIVGEMADEATRALGGVNHRADCLVALAARGAA